MIDINQFPNTVIDDCLLINGDCLSVMDKLIEQNIKVDAIITDPPYQTTNCAWDSIIPFNDMWHRINQLVNTNNVIVLFSSQPFTSKLILSNESLFKQELIWCKPDSADFVNAKNRHMKAHENIIIFSQGNIANGCKNKITYNPQNLIEKNLKRKVCKKPEIIGERRNQDNKEYLQKYTNYPLSHLYFKRDNYGNKTLHPTQKPIELMEYLIKTYTNENELVLDFTAGSFSTGVACQNTNRRFIGIELEEKYYNIGVERMINNKVNK